MSRIRKMILGLAAVLALAVAPVLEAGLLPPITGCVGGQLHVWLFNESGELVGHVTSTNWSC